VQPPERLYTLVNTGGSSLDWTASWTQAWVTVTPAGEVSIVCPQTEIGQGVFDSLARIVADELDADWSKVIVLQPHANPAFNSWLLRSFSDVHLLASQVEDGLYPYAGVPWFSCPFGRDGLITARQLLLVEPRLARGVLGFLAENQAHQHDPASDAEPGKILHGKVAELAVLPDSASSRYTPNLKVYPCTIHIEGTHPWLKPGMNAKVEIIIQQLADVMYVPVQSIEVENDQHFCLCVNSDRSP
jgi:hypothetical protein